MDGERFDTLARAMTTMAGSRRQATGLLLGAATALGLAQAVLPDAAVGKKRKKKKDKCLKEAKTCKPAKSKECCSKLCCADGKGVGLPGCCARGSTCCSAEDDGFCCPAEFPSCCSFAEGGGCCSAEFPVCTVNLEEGCCAEGNTIYCGAIQNDKCCSAAFPVCCPDSLFDGCCPAGSTCVQGGCDPPLQNGSVSRASAASGRGRARVARTG